MKKRLVLLACSLTIFLPAFASAMVLERTITEVSGSYSDRLVSWDGSVDDEYGSTSSGGVADIRSIDILGAPGESFSVDAGGNVAIPAFFIGVPGYESQFGFGITGTLPTVEEWRNGLGPTITDTFVVMTAKFYGSDRNDSSFQPLLEEWTLADNLDITAEVIVLPDGFDMDGNFSLYRFGSATISASAIPAAAVPEPGSVAIWLGLVAITGLPWLKKRLAYA